MKLSVVNLDDNLKHVGHLLGAFLDSFESDLNFWCKACSANVSTT